MESQENDPESILNWTRALISLRKNSEALWADSRFIPIFNEEQPYPMVYLRSNGTETFLTVLYADLGYTNPTSFRRAFKKKYGVAPNAIRE